MTYEGYEAMRKNTLDLLTKTKDLLTPVKKKADSYFWNPDENTSELAQIGEKLNNIDKLVPHPHNLLVEEYGCRVCCLKE